MSDTGDRKVVSDPSPPGAVLNDRSEREEVCPLLLAMSATHCVLYY